MKRFLSLFAGFLTGILVGAAVAILLAPTSGEQLQSQIRDRATNIREEVAKAAAERRAELEEQLAALREPKEPETPR